MGMRFSVEVVELRTRDPFTIARGGGDLWPTVVVEVEEDGLVAYGEGAPREYYGEEAVSCATAARSWLQQHGSLVDVPPQAVAELGEDRMAARAALDLALHDLQAQRRGLGLVDVLVADYSLRPTQPPPLSSFTIGLDTTERMAEKAVEASGFPILKVKLGCERDEAILDAIRAVSQAELKVDANAAWTVEETRRMAPLLVERGVTLLEQPLAREDLEGYRALHGELPLPVFVDESCRWEADVGRVDGRVDGINLKLGKCGGLGPCARMIAEARRRGLGVMLGCFVESSVSITAGGALATFVDHADLDGAALVANDPFYGATIAGGEIALPPGPGLGARRREGVR